MIHLLEGGGGLKYGSRSSDAAENHWYMELGRMGKNACRQVEHGIIEHPAPTLVVALGIGVMIGWILKRLR